MSKTYQIKAIDAAGKPLLETLQSASGRGPLTLQALPGVRYSLIDVQQGSAPDNIRVQRAGKHLKVLFDGSSQPDLVLENYFESVADAPYPTLTGATDSGAIHEYVPETGRMQDDLQRLTDGSLPQGMALGGMELATTTGAAVGLLAPVAGGGIGLGAAGAGALGAAALGSGGGGGGSTTPKPVVTALHLATESDSGTAGDYITSQQKPTIVGKATAGSQVSVTLNNKVYATTADANGDFSITVDSEQLNAGRYTLQAVATKNGAVSDAYSGIPFSVDTLGDYNIDAAGATVRDDNTSVTLNISGLSNDTGVPGDFITSSPHQTLTGNISGFTNNGDRIKVTLTRSGTSEAPISNYLLPDASRTWTWNLSDQTLNNGQYAMQAFVVDGADNRVSGIARQTVIIDSSANKNSGSDGSITDDTNTSNRATITGISLDSGVGNNASDFITNDNTLVFSGSVQAVSSNDDMVKVQLKEASGTVKDTKLVELVNGRWTWDKQSTHLDDGNYTLEATIVDRAGNVVQSAASASQVIQIDTLADKLINGATDTNASLVVGITGMQDSSGANGDTGSIPDDWITKTTQLQFTGDFGTDGVRARSWTDNGAVFSFQIFNTAGHLVASADNTAIASDGKSWRSSLTNTLNDGSYIARAMVTDAAGNVLTVDHQGFRVDHAAPSTLGIVMDGSLSTGQVTTFTLSANEAVQYDIMDGATVLASGQYTNQASSTGAYLNGTFNAFRVVLTDAAGNTSTFIPQLTTPSFNQIEIRTTHNSNYKSSASLTAQGDIGSYTLSDSQTLDLTTLINDTSAAPVVAHNSFDMMGTSTQHLSLNLNDVLSLGISHSFVNSSLVQLRVTGDNQDRVTLEDLTSSQATSAWKTPQTITIDAVKYAAYISADNQAEVLIQQGILVS